MENQEYSFIVVESFIPNNSTGRHGKIHVRPVEGQDPFKKSMFVECNKDLVNDYPIGTKFRIKGKITSKEGGAPFVYSHYKWTYIVLKD